MIQSHKAGLQLLHEWAIRQFHLEVRSAIEWKAEGSMNDYHYRNGQAFAYFRCVREAERLLAKEST